MDDNGRALDLDGMRARYAAERARRQPGLGVEQYKFAEGNYAHLADDPYCPTVTPRDAVEEDVDFLVVGAGIGGILMSNMLLEKGIGNFRIVDVAGDFGGTWYWNRYPGLRCDVESYIYLPLLEETGYVPTELYSSGQEIFTYLKMLAARLDLPKRALFQTRITGMRWDEESSRWIVTSDRGDRIRARFVSTQSGLFNRPQLPGIPGIDSFRGRIFHSARWDYAYTGGGPGAPMDRIADKRFGLIGTGATALQVVPELAKSARQLTVFQRTPTSVAPRNNGPTDMAWFKSLPKGWQRQRIHGFNKLSMGEQAECGVDDGWTHYFRRMIDAVTQLPEAGRTAQAVAAAQEEADFALNETIRARVDDVVADPAKRAALKAYYRTMCKRPGFSDDYLPAFNRDNVTVVDVSGSETRITADGMCVDGTLHPLDCLIFCTGFEIATSWAHQAGYDVQGRNGVRISEKWAEGPLTYHGLFSVDFPNMFFMGVTQTAATINIPHMLEEQARHVAFIVQHCLAQGIGVVETTAQAEQAWQVVMRDNVALRRPFQEACTPGYYNGEGRVEDRRNGIGNGWYMPTTQFFDMWESWRRDGTFRGLELR